MTMISSPDQPTDSPTRAADQADGFSTFTVSGCAPGTVPLQGQDRPETEAAGTEAGALLSDWQIETAHARADLLRRYDDVTTAIAARGESVSQNKIAALLGVSGGHVHRILKLWRPGWQWADLVPPIPKGRPSGYMLAGAELAAVRETLIRLDESDVRGRGRGTAPFVACRLAAQSDDVRITPEFRAIMMERERRTLPPSIAAALQTATPVLARARDKRSTLTTYISTPRGRTWVDSDGREHVTGPGDCLSADDGTLNCYLTIPWPFGGDKCSEKFGVRLGRWQFLPVIDDRSEFCIAFDIIARQSSAYSASDVAALMGRAMTEIVKPEWWLLERGSWDSAHVRRCLELADARVKNAWESKQKSAVERFFDRAWTPMAMIPGHVGRDRGRYKETTDLALACMDGRRDPRDYFLDLAEGTRRIAKHVDFVNGETIESRSGWGRWVPRERFESAMTEIARAPRRLPAPLSIFFAREQRVRRVRGAAIGFMVESPLIRFPVCFQHEALWEFEGCEVKVFFDPYSDPCLGTITLQDSSWKGLKRGHIIASDVPALELDQLPPQAVFAEDWQDKDGGRSLAVRKAISKAVRTETWNYLGTRTTTARDGMGNTTRTTGAATSSPCPLNGERAGVRGDAVAERTLAAVPPSHRNITAAPLRRDSVAELLEG